MMSFDPRPGYGEFRVEVSPDDEQREIAEAVVRARTNTARPGHWWWRYSIAADGVVKGVREYHVDLQQGVVEVREHWENQETAWRSFPLPTQN